DNAGRHPAPPLQSSQSLRSARSARSAGSGSPLLAVSLDDHDVRLRVRCAQRDQCLILGRPVAFQCALVALELDHDNAPTDLTRDNGSLAAPDQEAGTNLLECGFVGGDVALVACHVRHIDCGNPVSLAHTLSLAIEFSHGPRSRTGAPCSIVKIPG